jgi:hypothetical protein
VTGASGVLVRTWLRHRQVRHLSIWVLAVTVITLAVLGWRIRTDQDRPHRFTRHESPGYRACLEEGSRTRCDLLYRRLPDGRFQLDHGGSGRLRVDDLVDGPRHLLAPLAVVAALAVALAASVSSSQAGSGLASFVIVTDRTPGRGAVAQLAAGVTGALVWFLAAAVLVSAGAVVLTAVLGQGTVVSGAAAASVATMIARLGLSVAAAGALATALGLALPGRSLPTVLVIVGPVLVELLLLVVTRGTTDLIPGGTVGVLAIGADALRHQQAPGWVAVAVPAGAWVGAPAAGLLLTGAVLRWRPLP